MNEVVAYRGEVLVMVNILRLLKKRRPEADRSADTSAYYRGWGLIETISAAISYHKQSFRMAYYILKKVL